MAFIFDFLAPFFGGIIAELYKQKKVRIAKVFLSFWVVISLCLLGAFFSSDYPFISYRSFLHALGGGFITSLICCFVLLILKRISNGK